MAVARVHPSFQAMNRTELAVVAIAVAIGVSIAYIDSRPYWDDILVTGFSLVVFAAFLGFLAPRRVWLWALGIGIWIPLVAFVRMPGLASARMLLVLGLTFAGAYAGRKLRNLTDRGQPPEVDGQEQSR